MLLTIGLIGVLLLVWTTLRANRRDRAQRRRSRGSGSAHAHDGGDFVSTGAWMMASGFGDSGCDDGGGGDGGGCGDGGGGGD